MIDLTTYALLRKQITTAASGVSDVRAEGDELVFVLADGHEVRVAIPATEIRDAVVRDDVLVLTLEDDKEVVVDATLTQNGQAADAKATGEAVNQLKGDLADKLPKSPANWEQWTAEEQAAARERIGIPGDWELIENTTITEEITTFYRDKEPDGNPYNFIAMVLRANFGKVPSDVEYGASVYNVRFSYYKLYDYFTNRKISGNASLISYVDCSGKCPNFNSFVSNNTGASLTTARTGFMNTFARDALCQSFTIDDITVTGIFPAGVEFSIWGVRA